MKQNAGTRMGGKPKRKANAKPQAHVVTDDAHDIEPVDSTPNTGIGQIVELETRDYDGSLAWVQATIERDDGDDVTYVATPDDRVHAKLTVEDLRKCVRNGEYKVTRGSCHMFFVITKRGRDTHVKLILTPDAMYETYEEAEQRAQEEELMRQRMKKINFMHKLDADAESVAAMNAANLREERTSRMIRKAKRWDK